jgi:ATP-binding cassette, subfamily B, multidrug efflux pump
MFELKQLNAYILKYKWRFFTGVLFVTISNLFAIFPAQVIRYAFDLVKENLLIYNLFEGFSFQEMIYSNFSRTILLYGALVIVFALIKGLFMFFMRQTLIIMSRLVEFDLKNDIYAQYQLLDMAFYKKNNTGDLMNRISEDVSKVRMYIGPAIMYSVNLIVLFILVITTMVMVNPTLTFYVLLPLPFLSISIYIASDLINKKSEVVQRKLSQLSSYVQESFAGVRVIKAYNREDNKVAVFDHNCNDYKDSNLELVKVNAVFQPMMILLIGLSTIITVFIGGRLAIDGQVSAGNIAEFVIYVNMLTWPVAALGWVTSIVQRAAASQQRINEFLNAKPEITNQTNEHIDIKGSIEFKNVSFVYPESGIVALNNISFKVNPGESLAIIGKTGSGKSTIAALIARLFDTTSGTIFIDDVPIKNINLNDLRSNIGYAPQEVFLFSDSIANNISFGIKNNTINQADIELAAKNAAVYENINNFPEKFETEIGERGITLSGGQKQRISIARAIIRNPKILLFDDCLSAVDTETEKEIIENLKNIMQNKTTIIISHRISSVKHADKIIVIAENGIEESGSHEELMNKKGYYFELFNKQQLDELKKNESI